MPAYCGGTNLPRHFRPKGPRPRLQRYASFGRIGWARAKEGRSVIACGSTGYRGSLLGALLHDARHPAVVPRPLRLRLAKDAPWLVPRDVRTVPPRPHIRPLRSGLPCHSMHRTSVAAVQHGEAPVACRYLHQKTPSERTCGFGSNSSKHKHAQVRIHPARTCRASPPSG